MSRHLSREAQASLESDVGHANAHHPQEVAPRRRVRDPEGQAPSNQITKDLEICEGCLRVDEMARPRERHRPGVTVA